MATNFYFQHGAGQGRSSEQLLVEDLIIEAMKIYGMDVYYLPRSLQNLDNLFAEDSIAEFKTAFPIEMYLESVNGFGEQYQLSKFGIQLEESATFEVARRRWDEVVGRTGTSLLPLRPAEGDLIYFPKTDSLFEIKNVSDKNPFYQIGKLYTYKLDVELFQYSSENVETGIPEIDNIEEKSLDIRQFCLLDEDGTYLLDEDGSRIIDEEYNYAEYLPSTDNETVQSESDDILDFTEINPFGETR